MPKYANRIELIDLGFNTFIWYEPSLISGSDSESMWSDAVRVKQYLKVIIYYMI